MKTILFIVFVSMTGFAALLINSKCKNDNALVDFNLHNKSVTFKGIKKLAGNNIEVSLDKGIHYLPINIMNNGINSTLAVTNRGVEKITRIYNAQLIHINKISLQLEKGEEIKSNYKLESESVTDKANNAIKKSFSKFTENILEYFKQKVLKIE